MSEEPSEPATASPSSERRRDEMLDDVRRGLTASPRELSPKYFYDRRGSELFERITRLPEYYLTRDEIEILRGPVHERVLRFAPATLVELGAGSARKSRILLDAITRARPNPRYVPIDVSARFLAETARALRSEFPALRVEPEVADFTRIFTLAGAMERPALLALLGSTIGNLPPPSDRELLGRVRELMAPEDRFLLGADLRPGEGKPVERIEAAYDDAEGVTADFNRNVLRVLNRELGTDFDVDAFEHRAHYDAERHRIEMRLVARERQRVRLPDGTSVEFEAGDAVRTEVSCKYDRTAVEEMLGAAAMAVEDWMCGPEGRYAVVLARPLEEDVP